MHLQIIYRSNFLIVGDQVKPVEFKVSDFYDKV